MDSGYKYVMRWVITSVLSLCVVTHFLLVVRAFKCINSLQESLAELPATLSHEHHSIRW
eukprot:m.767074 g.767074  ORF g.767074 m.767074 type:complete len:59 (-) comp23226_c0_seq3:2166-2342(-)